MADVYIENDNTPLFKAAKDAAIQRALIRFGLRAEQLSSDLCPVDTGRLKGSIASTVDGDMAVCGTNVEYAMYVEMGTSKAAAQPFLRPAAKKKSDYAAILKDELSSAGSV